MTLEKTDSLFLIGKYQEFLNEHRLAQRKLFFKDSDKEIKTQN